MLGSVQDDMGNPHTADRDSARTLAFLHRYSTWSLDWLGGRQAHKGRQLKHYRTTALQPDDAIDIWGLSFRLGNAIKYIVRAPHKEKYSEDLIKAIWYLSKEVSEDTILADKVVQLIEASLEESQ